MPKFLINQSITPFDQRLRLQMEAKEARTCLQGIGKAKENTQVLHRFFFWLYEKRSKNINKEVKNIFYSRLGRHLYTLNKLYLIITIIITICININISIC